MVVQLLSSSVGISKRTGREIMAALAGVDSSQATALSSVRNLHVFCVIFGLYTKSPPGIKLALLLLLTLAACF
jgi:hypothetical protein